MGARWDRREGQRFYFGNAYRDLASQLPKDEWVPSETLRLIDENHALLDSLESSMNSYSQVLRELSFLIEDLKRSTN